MRHALLIPIAALLWGCSNQEPKVSATDARVVASPGGAAAYFSLRNDGGADRLLAVETPGSGSASLHESTMTDGVMRMRPLSDGVAIGHGETVALKPGGMHVMMMPSRQLAPGDKVALTLRFERSPVMVLEAPVISPMQGAHH